MKKSSNQADLILNFSISCIGSVILLLGVFTTPGNRLIIGCAQILSAVILYLLSVYYIAKRNWLDVRAVFTCAWIGTIGGAELKLTNYQEIWQLETWLILALGYLLFEAGAYWGIRIARTRSDKFSKIFKKIGRVHFKLHENRLFPICVTVTLIGLICFIVNVFIKGSIPAFSPEGNAYANFYTKFYLFAVAASMISGLCYYCIRTQSLSKVKKAILYLCILYSTFIFPLLIVSRGTFMASAISLTTVVFYVHHKKLIPLILSVIVILSVYMAGSALRGYTDEQLNCFFEPSKIVISKGNVEVPSEDELSIEDMTADSSEYTGKGSNDNKVEKDANRTKNPNPEFSFSLSPKMSFLYTYLTVGHDNFNEAVQNSQKITYGARSLVPFNVIFRIEAIDAFLENAEFYQVREHLNTVNFMGDIYYDFHSVSLFIVLLWALAFGAIQEYAEIRKGPFSLMTLGHTMVPVALSCFSAWMSLFATWMHWGLVLILCIVATIEIDKR